MNDDTISRQAAIDYFVTNVGFNDEDGYPIGDSDELRKIWTECFDEIPSTERRGRWKPFDLTLGRSVYACTSCGEALEVPTDFVCGKPMYEFCPYCGAKMDEVEE